MDLLCPQLSVNNAKYAACEGEYEATQVRIFPSYFFMMIDDKYFFPQDIRVDWAPERVVYKHTERDRWSVGTVFSILKIIIFGCRYIFWSKVGPSWSIGPPGGLENGGNFYKSRFRFRKIPPWTKVWLFSGGSDAKEPWQNVWLSGVTVKCSKSGKMLINFQLSTHFYNVFTWWQENI